MQFEGFDPDSEEVRRVRWKVDKRLIPMLSLLYLCSYLDRVNLGNAKVANLEADLNLTSGLFNMAGSIFYIGYILGEIPANLALKKVGPKIWLPLTMIGFGGMSMCTAAVTNGAGLLATRFFLGLAESGYAPTPVFIISLWYPRREHAFRAGIFFSTATVAGAFGGLVAYGISQLQGLGGLRAWQWIFLLEGLFTVACCIIVYLILPDFPETSTFLSPAEKELNIKRLKFDAGPASSTAFSWPEFWAAFKDWKVYAFIYVGLLHAVALTSLGLFVPSITRGFGYDPIATQLMTVPIYTVACFCTLLCAYSSDRFTERGFHVAAPMFIAAVGYVLLIITRHSSLVLRYISLVICTSGVYAAIPVLLAWKPSIIGGHAKRGTAIAFVMAAVQIGGIIGGQVYRNDDAPLYVRGNATCAGILFLDVFSLLGFKYILYRENRRRDQLTPKEYEKECQGSDATDMHPDFRYIH
ncbi:hypothetical protein KVV02_004673 [Mortierella alpina]|uniref:Major facilitator superfamily (MFS) profile domain-containing protein n=1 Tax=Mortierella alpina TaxID=64518 RepID=A0A9P8A714_MORAP|nr:hypothetical protein KVV02_004673 [Mortierella alpina]